MALSGNSALNLVTLNKLKQVTSGLQDNDLFYILTYDALAGEYKATDNSVTLKNFNEYTKSANGTAISYNAGVNAGNVFLIPASGKVPNSMLTNANNDTKGIVSQSENISCTDGIVNLKPNINVTKISLGSAGNLLLIDNTTSPKIVSAGNLELTGTSLIFNGETFLGNYINNQIILQASGSIELSRNNKDNPLYYFGTIPDTIDFITTGFSPNNKTYNFALALKSATAKIVTINTVGQAPFVQNLEAGKAYILEFTVIPPPVFGTLYIVNTNIKAI